ncbi:MAG: hypothetical protein WBE81_30260, partial [Pseudolabrys sp.]
IGLAVAVGLAYFLVAKFSVRLILQPAGVAVFWPAAGISSGILIALGPHAAMAGIGWGDGRDCCDSPHHQRPPLGRRRLGLVQRSRSRDYSWIDPAILG